MNGDMHELVDTDRGLISRHIFIEPEAPPLPSTSASSSEHPEWRLR
jgi:hypothetical protein